MNIVERGEGLLFVATPFTFSDDYPVDYYIEGRALGVSNRDKARLATIVLQHLNGVGLDSNSMMCFRAPATSSTAISIG